MNDEKLTAGAPHVAGGLAAESRNYNNCAEPPAGTGWRRLLVDWARNGGYDSLEAGIGVFWIVTRCSVAMNRTTPRGSADVPIEVLIFLFDDLIEWHPRCPRKHALYKQKRSATSDMRCGSKVKSVV